MAVAQGTAGLLRMTQPLISKVSEKVRQTTGALR